MSACRYYKGLVLEEYERSVEETVETLWLHTREISRLDERQEMSDSTRIVFTRSNFADL